MKSWSKPKYVTSTRRSARQLSCSESQAIEQDVSVPIGVGMQESTSIEEKQVFTPNNFNVNEVTRFEQHAPYFQHLPPYSLRHDVLPNYAFNGQRGAGKDSRRYWRLVRSEESGSGQLD
ncbi:Uncharacterized protein Fot_19652 [Forsythia ovata]|uniref:Uncharacterized protein n=1 Tax=Forsythia ovata TaxID=205694 RepID=A0ABD1VLN6_9LAMI